MNRRDQSPRESGGQDFGGQQAGGYRDDSQSRDTSQASQWSDTGRQAGGNYGGSWGTDDDWRPESRREQGASRGDWQGDRDDEPMGRSSDRTRWSDDQSGSRGMRERGWQERGMRGRDMSGDWHDRDYAGTSPGFADRHREEAGYGRRVGYGRSSDWSRGWGREGARDWGRRGQGGSYRQHDREHDHDRGQDNYHPQAFDAAYGNRFASFTSEDFGGRDFYSDRASSRFPGGVSGGMHPSDTYRPSYGPGSGSFLGRDQREDDDYASWREQGERRGFLSRAGDEIASWFGDEDAARRREMDHRENHAGRGPSDYTRSDERIREDVNDRLTHDWRLDATSVRVRVSDAEVTLEGTVETRSAKRRAEDVAEDVAGVRHVQNNLRVEERPLSRTGGSMSNEWSGGSAAGMAGAQTGSSTATGTTGSATASPTTTGTSATGASGTGSTGSLSTGSSATGSTGSHKTS